MVQNNNNNFNTTPTFIDDTTVLCLDSWPLDRNILGNWSIFSPYAGHTCMVKKSIHKCG